MSASRIDAAGWQKALLADLGRQAALAPDRRVVSIFAGGGTPIADAAGYRSRGMIARVKQHWPTARNLEITPSKPTPNSAEAKRFAGFAAAGVSRLSLGIQALGRWRAFPIPRPRA